MAVKKVLALNPRPAFVITGGDHVMDANKVGRDRADLQFRLVEEALKPLEMPVYHAVGNHDIFGWDKAVEGDTLYGKKMFEEKVAKGPSYRSFDMGGWHFVVLDSIQQADTYNWRGVIDEGQLSWLESDLAMAGKTPTVVTIHMPVLSVFPQYVDGNKKAVPETLLLGNGMELQKLFAKHNVKAVLQGHTHVVEECDYLGTKYITGGAVCGDWWKGYRLGVHPEGFGVFDVDGDSITWAYQTYGWKARK